MWYIIFNRGGNTPGLYVGKGLEVVSSKEEAKMWSSYQEAVAFCKAPDFATTYGPHWGVVDIFMSRPIEPVNRWEDWKTFDPAFIEPDATASEKRSASS